MPMPTSLIKLALPMPNLPPCSLPTGRRCILLQKLALPICPAMPDPLTPELCGKISSIELEIEETVDDLELIVACNHAVELPQNETGINLDHRCVVLSDRLFVSGSPTNTTRVTSGPGISTGPYLRHAKPLVMAVATTTQTLSGQHVLR